MQTEVGNIPRVHQELDGIVKRRLDAAVQLSEILEGGQLADLVRERAIVGEKQVTNELLDCLRRELERLVLRRSHDVLEHARERDDELADETTDKDDTVVSRLRIANIVNLHF